MRKVSGLVYTAVSNARFAKMTDAEKRVAIAEDVLKAIATKRIVPEHGTYLQAPDPRLDRNVDLLWSLRMQRPRASIQKLLPTLPPCHVCAKGAIFVCTVARQNKVTVGQGMRSYSQDLSEQLDGIFSTEQLTLIEERFEGFFGFKRYPGGPTRRMERIMKSIVRNGGTFVP